MIFQEGENCLGELYAGAIFRGGLGKSFVGGIYWGNFLTEGEGDFLASFERRLEIK
jgi:hypothetical protein